MSMIYVIAAWTGARRAHPKLQVNYVRTHIDQLNLLTHKLDQLAIVVTDNPSERLDDSRYFNSLQSLDSGTPVSVIRRENIGLSYGSYSYAFELFGTRYDYFIFIEDDYVFVQNEFDSKLVSIINEDDNCGYVCTLISRKKRWPKHAGNTNGIARSSALSDIFANYGELPHSKSMNGYKGEGGQIPFSRSFLDLGYGLDELASRYSVPFQDHHGKIVNYGKPDGEWFIIPQQLLKNV